MGEPSRSRARLIAAGVLLALYALPLFWPPGPSLPMPAPDDGTMARLFPGVPALWVAGRLAALLLAAVLLSDVRISARRDPLRQKATTAGTPGAMVRLAALAVAVAQALAAPWAAARLGPAGQTAYVALLFAPAALLALGRAGTRPSVTPRTRQGALATAAVIVVWTGARLATDVGSPRAADAVDGWRGIVGLLRLTAERESLLTTLWDPELPGLGALPLLTMGAPLFQAGLLPLRLEIAQVLQILWLAATAAGLGLLARMFAGRGTAAVAAATFLFAPYALFMAALPGPFLAGPLYVTALALCTVFACRYRSEAALAAMGALGGIALTFPGAIPVGGFLGAFTCWRLRRDWRRCWVGAAAGAAALAAVVVPALDHVITPQRMGQHLGAHGSATLLEAALLGQAPVAAFAEARAAMTSRPLEIAGAALVEPFANPRTPIRLWGDAIFDPLGAALVAVGLAAALRHARASAGARFVLLFYAAALGPALVSPVDRVDIVHAVALPVPAALLAAAAFAGLRRRCGLRPRARGAAAAAVTVAIAAGGTALFDLVNPRILPASAMGIVFRSLAPGDTSRVVVLDYPPGHTIDVRWLFTGVMTAYGGPAPLGYLPYDGGALPARGLAAEAKDLLFWSPGLDADLGVTAAVCRQWPAAALYDVADAAGLGRAFAARLGDRPWAPALPPARWRQRPCPAPVAATPRPDPDPAMPTRPAGSRAPA